MQYYVLNVSFPNSPHPYDILSMMVDTASPTSIVADDVANRHAANKTGVADPGMGSSMTALGGVLFSSRADPPPFDFRTHQQSLHHRSLCWTRSVCQRSVHDVCPLPFGADPRIC